VINFCIVEDIIYYMLLVIAGHLHSTVFV